LPRKATAILRYPSGKILETKPLRAEILEYEKGRGDRLMKFKEFVTWVIDYMEQVAD
jgi:hypothetical protein